MIRHNLNQSINRTIPRNTRKSHSETVHVLFSFFIFFFFFFFSGSCGKPGKVGRAFLVGRVFDFLV